MSLPSSDQTKQPDGLTTMQLGAVLPKTAQVKDGHLFIDRKSTRLNSSHT